MGSNAAYNRDDGLHHEGAPEQSGTQERGRKQPSFSRAPTTPIGPASGEAAGDPPTSKPWCIDHGGWLEAMSTVALWRALETGAVHHGMRIWREGLECWTPASDVRALFASMSGASRPCAETRESDDPCAPSEPLSEPESTGPLSFALTPDDLRAVAPRWTLTGTAAAVPGSTREQRAETATLHPSRSAADRSLRAREEPPSPPISVDLSDSFPPAPPSELLAPVTLPSVSLSLSAPPSARVAPVERLPAQSGWKHLPLRIRVPRSPLSVAAASAIAALVLGLVVLNAVIPSRAPFPAAQIGFGPSTALAAARRLTPAAAPSLSRLSGVVVPDLAPASPESQPERAAAAPIPQAPQAVDPAPVNRRERGQYRLRRGRIENGVARRLAAGAKLRDSR